MDEFIVNVPSASKLMIEAVSTPLKELFQFDISSPFTNEMSKNGSEATSSFESGSSQSFSCAFESSNSHAGPR